MNAITIIPGQGGETTTATLRDQTIQKAQDAVLDAIFDSLDALIEQWATDNFLTFDEKSRRKGVEVFAELIR